MQHMAAIKIQEACYNSKAFELRIGIHQGEVVFENADVFGDAVNIASHLQETIDDILYFICSNQT